ncbi:MAG: hypothetical protein JSU70_15785 [Phycisphaerales bacterium]|nr:MAG: hypothetical protein JSU70_15785 [Phycisphaerales bacterium]
MKLLLRVIGTAALLALGAVVMPYSWMNAVHGWLGMGRLPQAPIVSYLARSTSGFYVLLGGLFWVVSFDLRRHEVVLYYLGVVIVVFGAALFVIDLAVGMPLFWSLGEGPFNTALGIVILFSSRRLRAGPSHAYHKLKESE